MQSLAVMDEMETQPTEEVFTLFQKLVQNKLGIFLTKKKRLMLGHRLLKRVKHIKANGFSEYFHYINTPENSSELELALELITTNETFFFRESKHFDYLQDNILPKLNPNQEFRIWSAACSSGEEPYSIAMLLAKHYGAPWSLFASDVNKTVLAQAKKAIYLDDRAQLIPADYRRSFCVKGTGEFEGYLRIKPTLRNKLNFFNFNLLDSMSSLGSFDLIFIRNVMIYFDDKTRQNIINHISKRLKPRGWLFISHSETLHGLEHAFELVQPAIYRLKN